MSLIAVRPLFRTYLICLIKTYLQFKSVTSNIYHNINVYVHELIVRFSMTLT